MNKVWERHKPVTKEYADSYDWWQEFLTARLNAIDSMVQLGKSNEEITKQLSFSDPNHVVRLKEANNIHYENPMG